MAATSPRVPRVPHTSKLGRSGPSSLQPRAARTGLHAALAPAIMDPLATGCLPLDGAPVVTGAPFNWLPSFMCEPGPL